MSTEKFPTSAVILGDDRELVITAKDINWGFEGRATMTTSEAKSAEEAQLALAAYRPPLPFKPRR